MVTLEFDDFVRQFRERTAQRMVEFEKALAKAQEDMAKAPRAGKSAGQKTTGRFPEASDQHVSTPVGVKKSPARHRRKTGPVQGVLKK